MPSEIVQLPQGSTAKALDSGEMERIEDAERRKQEGRVREIVEPILGIFPERSVIGPFHVEDALGVRLSLDDVPEIPFKKDELMHASRIDHRLVYRASHTADGEPLTLHYIDSLFGERSHIQRRFSSEYDPFAFTDTPRHGWALVSNTLIPRSVENNYIDQFDYILYYLKNTVFRNKRMPDVYKHACNEFRFKQNGLKYMISNKSDLVRITKASSILETLQITHLAMPTPVEMAYDLIVSYENFGVRLHGDGAIWTSTRVSHSSAMMNFVTVGSFDSNGIKFGSAYPPYTNPILGTCLSRYQ